MGWRIQASHTYLFTWTAFLSWDVSANYQDLLNGFLFGWYQNPVIKKTPTTRDLEFVTLIKMSMMEILERFSIFVVCYWGGYVVFSVKSPGLRFIYTGECRASTTSIRAIHFMVLWPTMAMSHSWPGPVWPMSPPFQMNWMLSFTFGEGHLSAWSPPLILFTSQDRFWWRGLGCLSAASACFIHFISESFSLISSVHLDHSLLQHKHPSHPEHFARFQPL